MSTVVESVGLGRRYAPDPRDEGHLARARLPEKASDRTYRYWWNNGARLDQGATGTCVGHAWEHLIQNSPITDPRDTPAPFDLYRAFVLEDEWTENDHEANAGREGLQFGTSVRAGAKVLQKRGIIGEYSWAWDVDTAVRWVLEKGPVVMGTWWYSSMFRTDDKGFLSVSGERVGGHAYVFDGVNIREGKARCLNSWGDTMGPFWIRLEDLDRLIRERGEACMTVELD